MTVSACIIIIGNEILSGRTQDANIRPMAKLMAQAGIVLSEARIIPDIRENIINTLTDVRARYDIVITTGGIGPTHDDITAAAIAETFGVPLVLDQDTDNMMRDYMGSEKYNSARQRMAMFPKGSVIIPNSISKAPGFKIGNVYTLAGVPIIACAMFEEVLKSLPHGKPIQSRSWHVRNLKEGDLAEPLEDIQRQYPLLDIGSYPSFDKKGPVITLIVRGTNIQHLREASSSISNMIIAFGQQPVAGDIKESD